METLGVVAIDGSGLTTEHYTGCASEHIAASYFLRKGWQVYWPAVQQGWVDFIVHDGEDYRRVQVKTPTWNKAAQSTDYWYLQCRLRSGGKYRFVPSDRFDILVMVHEIGMWVIPAKEVDHTSNLCLTSTNPNYKPHGVCYDKWKVS